MSLSFGLKEIILLAYIRFIVLKICEYQLHQMVYKIIAIAIFKKSQIITIIRMNVYFIKF